MKIRRALVAAGVTLALGALAACGGGASSSGGSGGGSGTLKVAYHLTPATLDPLAVPIWQLMTYIQPMYDTITYVDTDGVVQPMLATEWSFGDKTLDLTFRDDVTFHDGTKFDAEAFKANIDRLLATDDSPVRSMFKYVTGVEVTGEYTASLTLSETDSSLPAALGDRGGAMASPKALEDGTDLTSTDAGSGPYKLVEFKSGDHAFYERNEDYWDDEAAGVDRLEITGVGDGQARLNGATSKQYDLTYLTPSQFAPAEGAGLGVAKKPGLWFITLFMNRTRSEFADVKARQAVAHAIDREAICKAIYFDLCTPTSSIFPSDFWAGNPDVAGDFFDYDPDLSRKLLKEAGLEDGFEFSMLFAAGADPYPQFGELLQSQLAEVGITLNLEPQDINQLTPLYFFEKKGDALIGGGGQVADPGQSLQKEYEEDSALNPSADAPGGIGDVIAELRGATEEGDREALSAEAVQLIADNALNVPMIQPQVLFAYNPDTMAGFEPSFVGAYVPLRGVGLK